MTHMEAMAAIAQGVINITEAERGTTEDRTHDRANLNRIEHGSRVFLGMEAMCAEEAKTIERLKAIEACLREGFNRRSVEAAHKLVEAMIAERTDPEFVREVEP